MVVDFEPNFDFSLVVKEGASMYQKNLIIMFLILFFQTTLAVAVEPQFQIAPYLHYVKDGKIQISWTYSGGLKNPMSAVVKTSNRGIEQVIPANFSNGIYNVSLPLAACGFGDDVTYEVTGMSKPEKINDLPCEGDTRTVRFSFLADTQEGYDIAHIFAQQIRDFDGSFVLHGGDLVQTGNDFNEWFKFFEAMSPAVSRQVMFSVPGNHEYRWNVKLPMWKYFFNMEGTDNYYSMKVGQGTIIALNTNFIDDPSLRFKQLAWLKEELAKPSKWRIVFFHHPPFSRGFFNGPLSPKREHLMIEKDYVPVFEEYKVDLVLSGHSHLFEHSIKDGIHYLVTGAAGGMMGFMGGKNPYSLEVEKRRTIIQFEMNSGELRIVATTLEGLVLEEFTLKK